METAGTDALVERVLGLRESDSNRLVDAARRVKEPEVGGPDSAANPSLAISSRQTSNS